MRDQIAPRLFTQSIARRWHSDWHEEPIDMTLMGRAWSKIEAILGVHRAYAADCVVAGNNPILNCIALLDAAKRHQTLVFCNMPEVDGWDYRLLDSQPVRWMISSAMGMRIDAVSTEGWLDVFFRRMAAEICQSDVTALLELDRRFVLRLFNAPDMGEAMLYVVARTMADGVEHRNAVLARKFFDEHVRSRFSRLRFPVEAKRRGFVYARQVILTSQSNGFAAASKMSVDDDGRIEFDYDSPYILPIGSARALGLTDAICMREAISDIVRFSKSHRDGNV